MPYRFKVGEIVTAKSAHKNSNVPYEVIKQLPGTGGEPEYHIKSQNEPHQRLAQESELTKA